MTTDKKSFGNEPRWNDWITRIRVLEVLPANDFSSPLVGNLVEGIDNFQFRIAMPPLIGLYEALSYTWGDPSLTKPMVLNSTGTMITRNLNSALRHLRKPDVPRRLWVDALCIKQDDIADKNLFIPFMSNIYANASATIVWLGESDDQSDLALSILEDIGSGVQRDDISRPTGDYSSEGSHWAHHISEREKSSWRALNSLGSRPWWSRVWVIQEVACSRRSISLQAGYRLASWHVVLKGIHELRARLVYVAAAWQSDFSQLLRLQGALLMQPADSFHEALARGKDSNATDSRDKVFGVLDLPKLEKRVKIAVDYNKNVVEVYIEAARALLQDAPDLRMLALVDMADGPVERQLGLYDSLTSGLPSWVPDWADRRPNASISRFISDQMLDVGHFVPYHGTSTFLLRPGPGDGFPDGHGVEQYFKFTANPRELVVKGLILGSLFMLGPEYGEDKNLDSLMANIEATIDFVDRTTGQVTRRRTNAEEGSVKSESERLEAEQKDLMEETMRCITCNRTGKGTEFRNPISFPESWRDSEVIESVQLSTYDRRMFLTRHPEGKLGCLMGLGPRHIRHGDVIALVLGMPIPLVLRRTESPEDIGVERPGDKYSIVGTACR